MKCPNCHSSNIQSHIVTEDKHSRNSKILLAVLLPLILILLLFTGVNLSGLLVFFVIFVIFIKPIGMLLKIILTVIPARKKTVFVCNDCGTEFEATK